MKKQQWILGISGFIILLLLYFFGKTVPSQKKQNETASAPSNRDISIETILQASKRKLNAGQLNYLDVLEHSVVRGNVKAQQLQAYQQLATFWKDSAKAFLPAAWYAGEAAKLENMEKSLTFAAHLFLDNLRNESDPQLKQWMAEQAKQLFEKALKLNPGNDSTKVALGSCYLFGNIGPNPMQGVLMIREVADRDPGNLYAQMMLGVGGMMTGQFDRAIERFRKVVDRQPDNVEALFNLAEAYEQKGENESAINWYKKLRPLINDPEILNEVNVRITSLKNK